VTRRGRRWPIGFDDDEAIDEDVLVEPITATAALDDLVDAEILTIIVMAGDPPQRWYRRAQP
jgi:hypothetical protein